MKVIYDMAMGVGEPHYAQMIKADKIKPINAYPEVGWDPLTMAEVRVRHHGGRRAHRARRQ